MKKGRAELLLAVIVAWGVPWLLLGVMQLRKTQDTPPETTVHTEQPAPDRLRVLLDGSQVEMEMDTYLTGVLLSEIPGTFHMEAKKAQAVVARTYALSTAEKNAKHPGAVCTDYACCQGYTDPDAFPDREAAELAREAVEATRALVLTYNGQLIEATYFSCSGGRTEDAVAVWGSWVPYLQSVESPGEEQAAHYTDTVEFTPGDFQTALGLELSGKPENWFSDIRYTAGGGVQTVRIGGKEFSGTQLRQLLGLRSTAFSLDVSGECIRVTTRGFGHRVGMSQYGAQAMAEAGKSFQQILAHYYVGTRLSSDGR